MMNYPKPGWDSTGEYMVSALPWVTSSLASGITCYKLPKVTKYILVRNGGVDVLGVAFTQNGFKDGHFVPLAQNEQFSVDVRVKDVFISGSAGTSFFFFAGLTLIDRNDMPILTGSLTPGSGSTTWKGIG